MHPKPIATVSSYRNIRIGSRVPLIIPRFFNEPPAAVAHAPPLPLCRNTPAVYQPENRSGKKRDLPEGFLPSRGTPRTRRRHLSRIGRRHAIDHPIAAAPRRVGACSQAAPMACRPLSASRAYASRRQPRHSPGFCRRPRTRDPALRRLSRSGRPQARRAIENPAAGLYRAPACGVRPRGFGRTTSTSKCARLRRCVSAR